MGKQRLSPDFEAYVQLLLHAEDDIEVANGRHGQNAIAVLPTHVDISQHIVRDALYKAADIQGTHA